jgi:hypothetical protein
MPGLLNLLFPGHDYRGEELALRREAMEQQRQLRERHDALGAYQTLGTILGLEKSKRGPLMKMAGEMYGAKYGMDTETLTKWLTQVDDDTAKALAEAVRAHGVETKGDPAALLQVLNPQAAFQEILKASQAAQAKAQEAERNKVAGRPMRQGLSTPVWGEEEGAGAVIEERAPTNREEALRLLDEQERDFLNTVTRLQGMGGISEAQHRAFKLREDALKSQRARLGAKETGAESTPGKVGDDLARAERVYGKDSLQYKALETALAGGGEGPKLSDESTMRNQFVGQSKDFVTVRDSYARLTEAAANPSAAGDLAMIFNFMKMLDPGSVVREAEFANAQNAAGVPDRIRNLWNRLLSGERLNPEQRKDFVGQARGQFAAQRRLQKQLEDQYRGIARRSRIDPEQIVVDFIGDLRKDEPSAPATQSKPPTATKPSAVDEALKRLGVK